MAKQASTEEKRGRGRPANFPGQTVKARLYNLPVETIELIETEAERREEPLGVALNRLIERGFREFNRKRKR